MKIASPTNSSDDDDNYDSPSPCNITQDAPTEVNDKYEDDHNMQQEATIQGEENENDNNDEEDDNDNEPTEENNDNEPTSKQTEDKLDEEHEDIDGSTANAAPTDDTEAPPTEPPMPPTINEIVQHLMDPAEKTSLAGSPSHHNNH